MGQKPKEIDPYQSPAHFLGWRIRMWRERRGNPSQDAVAAQAQFTGSYLGRAERGDQLPSLQMTAAIDRALDAGGELIKLREDIERGIDIRYAASSDGAKTELHGAKPDVALGDQPSVETPWEGEDFTLPVVYDGKVIFVSVPRRALLGISAGAALSAAVPTTALASPPGGGAPVLAPDMHPLEQLRDARRVFIDMDNVLGPRAVIPRVVEQINVMQRMRRAQVAGGDRRGLMELLSQYAEFCGWIHQDAGDFRAAQYWTDRALEWSYAAGDPDLTVYILARKAQLAGDMGDPLLAIDNGQAALGMARADTRLPAVAAVYAAHGFALRGEEAESTRLYDQARRLMDGGDFDPSSPWGVWLDPAYVEVHRARSLGSLGKYPKAAEGFRTAIERMPSGYHRDKGVYLAREAMAYAGAKEPQQAAEVGIEALSIGAGTGSARILSELAALDKVLEPWRTAPGVSDFHNVLMHTVPHRTTAP